MTPKVLRAAALAALAVLGLTACATAEPGARQAATHGVVSSASPEATAAGVEILERGGNAIDAAIAVQFALAVTEPAMSGLGGQTQIIVHPPDGAPFVINGTSYAPFATPADVTAEDTRTGWTASTTPSTVRVADFAYRTYGGGTVSWAELIAPAIRYAEEGFAIGPFRAAVYRRHEADLRADPTVASLFLMPDGAPPQEWDVLRQPVLAGTLRRLAEAGAQDFYTGEIAAQISADMAANGGWVSAEDLAATPEPEVTAPLHSTYRGYDVYTLTPPAGGWAVLVALNALEATPREALDAEDAERATALLGALQTAHRARREDRTGAAQDHEAYIADRIARAPAAPAPSATEEIAGETTHFSVVDADGMAVSVTSSVDSYFGARVASPTLGFVYNNYMQSFDLEPGRPFSLVPRAAPYSSMSAAIVARDGAPQLVLGSPGSARIISAVTQVTSHWIDTGAGVEAAVAAARVHLVPDAEDGRDNAYLEQAIEGLDLGALGFDETTPQTDLSIRGLNAYFGGVHAIALEAGGWRGAADPRRDGAVGYAD